MLFVLNDLLQNKQSQIHKTSCCSNILIQHGVYPEFLTMTVYYFSMNYYLILVSLIADVHRNFDNYVELPLKIINCDNRKKNNKIVQSVFIKFCNQAICPCQQLYIAVCTVNYIQNCFITLSKKFRLTLIH